jgi:hypothetical protein
MEMNEPYRQEQAYLKEHLAKLSKALALMSQESPPPYMPHQVAEILREVITTWSNEELYKVADGYLVESNGHMLGCQSTNHEQCYGGLWQCAACGKTVCYAEGTDDHRELCDGCWVKQEENDVRF